MLSLGTTFVCWIIPFQKPFADRVFLATFNYLKEAYGESEIGIFLSKLWLRDP